MEAKVTSSVEGWENSSSSLSSVIWTDGSVTGVGRSAVDRRRIA